MEDTIMEEFEGKKKKKDEEEEERKKEEEELRKEEEAQQEDLDLAEAEGRLKTIQGESKREGEGMPSQKQVCFIFLF